MNNVFRVDGNDLMLLRNGQEYFPRLCKDIDAARDSVYLETYIFHADETGRMVADALCRAASRGLSVRVMLDGYGSAELPPSWLDRLSASNIEVLWFRREISPFTLRRSRMRRLRRLHRKLVVLDGEVAFVGGINIIDDIPASDGFAAPRLDYTVRVKGVTAGDIHVAMRRLWGLVSWANFRRRGKELKRFIVGRTRPTMARGLSLVLRDNLRHRHDIESAYLDAIFAARNEIIIANAYFLPRRYFRLALVQAARRGVRVKLLLQGRVEYRVQHYATQALYDQFLEAGVEIYEYQPSYLHAKVAVIDGVWSTVGSSNIDPYSFLLALEANLVIRDEGFGEALREHLLYAISQDAVRIGDDYGISRSWLDRLLARAGYQIVRWLIGILGYSRSA
jgi:cardiolipin synthase